MLRNSFVAWRRLMSFMVWRKSVESTIQSWCFEIISEHDLPNTLCSWTDSLPNSTDSHIKQSSSSFSPPNSDLIDDWDNIVKTQSRWNSLPLCAGMFFTPPDWMLGPRSQTQNKTRKKIVKSRELFDRLKGDWEAGRCFTHTLDFWISLSSSASPSRLFLEFSSDSRSASRFVLFYDRVCSHAQNVGRAAAHTAKKCKIIREEIMKIRWLCRLRAVCVSFLASPWQSHGKRRIICIWRN